MGCCSTCWLVETTAALGHLSCSLPLLLLGIQSIIFMLVPWQDRLLMWGRWCQEEIVHATSSVVNMPTMLRYAMLAGRTSAFLHCSFAIIGDS